MSELDDEYLSCEWAEGGLAFNRRSIHACLIVHHGKGYPFLADHNGGPLPINDILRIRGEIRKANQSGKIHPECRGCAHLKRKRWLPSAYPINIVGIAHYSHCNIACNYCFLQTQDRSSFESGYRPYPIVETIRELYVDGLLAPDAIIDWGGGEPTVYREFEDILALTLEAGAFHYLHSNGVKLPCAIRNTAYADRIHVICSVDAGLPDTYQLLKKRDCLEAVWTNLAEYIRIGCRVTIKYIVREDNCAAADLEAFVARAAEIGAKDFIIDTDYDYPDPAPKVIAAVARLQYLAVRAHIHTRFGFTGNNFAVENDIGSRVQTAFSKASSLERYWNFWVREATPSPAAPTKRSVNLKTSFARKSSNCGNSTVFPHISDFFSRSSRLYGHGRCLADGGERGIPQIRPDRTHGLAVGFGTNELRLVPEKQAIDTLLRGFDLGVNIIHTAPDYEGAEEIVAKAVARAGRKIIVASNAYDVHYNATGRVHHFEDLFEATCTRLRTDRLELYGIAAVDDREAFQENVWGRNGMVEFLLCMKEEGRIGSIFCTNHGDPRHMRKLIESDVFDAMMISLNPLGYHLLRRLGADFSGESAPWDRDFGFHRLFRVGWSSRA